MKNWPLTFTLKHEGANVENIYYTKAYFEMEGLTDPATAQPYTAEALAKIKADAEAEKENYIYDAGEGALIGMQAFNTGKTFWYDAENGKKIVSSAAPLILNGETGVFTTAEGEAAAKAMA